MEVTTKPFFSVFPDLKVSDDVRSLFEDANIRDHTKEKENTLKISFQCDHLISESIHGEWNARSGNSCFQSVL